MLSLLLSNVTRVLYCWFQSAENYTIRWAEQMGSNITKACNRDPSFSGWHLRDTPRRFRWTCPLFIQHWRPNESRGMCSIGRRNGNTPDSHWEMPFLNRNDFCCSYQMDMTTTSHNGFLLYHEAKYNSGKSILIMIISFIRYIDLWLLLL